MSPVGIAFAPARHLEHDARDLCLRARARAPPSGGRPIHTLQASTIQPWPSSACKRHFHFSTQRISAPTSFRRREAFDATAQLLVIEASGILEIDFTAAQILIDIIEDCRADGNHSRHGAA